ncbi:barstar family protein [Streptomyces sp. DSM 116496]|uniref:barstar family protein n=1 Tax=Streptomyces stoeckheimensis TaxID=3344656 RepID=UPI0038B3FF63
MTMIYVLDGKRIHTLEDFWLVIGEAVDGPGGYFGRNLDAFNDCLTGGYMDLEDGEDFVFEWHDHAHSQQALGYAETARQLEIRLERCHHTNRPRVAKELAAARAGEGPTVFDWLVEIFDRQVPSALALR